MSSSDLPKALALLVILVFVNQGGTVAELGQALEEVVVEHEVAGLSLSAFSREHTFHGESAEIQLVAEFQ